MSLKNCGELRTLDVRYCSVTGVRRLKALLPECSVEGDESDDEHDDDEDEDNEEPTQLHLRASFATAGLAQATRMILVMHSHEQLSLEYANQELQAVDITPIV